MENHNTTTRSFLVNKSILALSLFLLVIGSCSKKKGTESSPNPIPPVTTIKNYTSADATTAYNSFNTTYYSPADKLYYSTTEKKGIAAIWTQAIYWDMAMNAYERTKDAGYLKLINDIYEGGFKRYDGYNWDNTTEWFIYDDMMWWIISLTKAYEITGNTVYLDKAKSGFTRVWNGAYDPVKGGMFWDFQHSGKNACINYPTVIAAMKLYKITNDEAYFTKAKSIYAWSRDNLLDISKGRVADHKVGNNNPGFEDYTYNQGTFIGAAVLLYKQTNTQSYLDDAKLVANYTKATMSDANGILPAEGDWNEQGVLKSIFAQYLAELVKVAPTTDYAKWAIFNANTAWNNRDQTRGIMHRNYKIACPSGVVQSYESSSAVALMQLFISTN
ncbi:alpha-1,6-mannanase [Pedobacter frigiditerrae]|uniref:Alpha-1,6-mannanase n=1 Tax=Pedobacter frigiditerrae TaxID=2530452 RepID=A0A4R0MTS2_9SPHI|nr:glycoside hydrolase family 76 protein [Pedobacter frigiditerrae]TCC90117.1 alpha-1,6-mannanase [Pedobacter frigiditerrae]